jgi:neutral ceramidase
MIRQRLLIISLAWAVGVLFGALHTPTFAADGWKAGAAKVVITPRQFMWMAGYGGRDHPAEGKLTDLWAKALVLEDAEGRRAVVVTLDLVGIERELSLSLCAALKERYALERAQIALCTSHTHTGPVVARNLRPMHYLLLDAAQQKLIDQYADFLEQQVVAVVGQAIERLAPSQLSWGSGTATFAVNRRNNPEAQVPQLREQNALKGPFDHDVPVLAVKSADGRLTAVMFGYACHATVLSFYQWSADYPGFAQIELEKSHPDCVALFWAGCGADQNPLPRRTVELAQDYGKQLATAVDAVLAKEMSPVSAKLTALYREIDLPLGTLPTRDEIEQDAKSSNKFVAARGKMLLGELDAGRPLKTTYPYPVATWRLGDEIQFVILGGEVVVDYSLRLKTELAGTKTWVAGYANDVMAYIPSRRVLREGGYEGGGAMVYYGLPTAWAPAVEEAIVEEVRAQIRPAK